MPKQENEIKKNTLKENNNIHVKLGALFFKHKMKENQLDGVAINP